MKNKTSKFQKKLHSTYALVIRQVILHLRLKGSWFWALREMGKGKLVTRKNVTGSLKYRFSKDGQNRIQWDFHRNESEARWESGIVFLGDAMATDWIIYNWS
ncbi:MAG: hypothetical protein ACOYN4_04500 [Bacteroidales bacterium]